MLATWLLLPALAVVFTLAVARSELVRRRRGVSVDRRRALLTLQSGSALLALTMLAFERAFGLPTPIDAHPAVHLGLLLTATCLVLYGTVRYFMTGTTG